MTRKELYIGSKTDPLYYFENDGIISIDGEIAVSLVGQELCPDALEAVVKYDVLAGETLKEHGGSILKDSSGKVLHGSQNNDIRTLPYSTPIWYYSGGVLIGKFYSTHVERLTKDTYRINAQSVIGVLDDETYYGKFTTTSTTTFKDWVNNIVLTDGLSDGFVVDYCYGNYTLAPLIETNDVCPTDRIKFKIKLKEIYADTAAATVGHTGRAPIFGITAANDTYRANWPDDIDYGIYFNATKTGSGNYDYAVSGDCYFGYNGNYVDIGRINIGDTIEADINPSAGTATINGTTYSITKCSTTTAYRWFYMCHGTQLNYYNSYYRQTSGINTNIYIYYFDVIQEDGTILKKARPITQNVGGTNACLVDVITGEEYSYNTTDIGAIIQPEEKYLGCADPNDAQYEMYNSVEYEEGIDTLTVYNAVIPVCTKREALYYLLFASGVSLIRGTEGGMLFTYLKQSTPISISDNDIYKGGSVDYLSDTYKIELTEHSWYMASGTTAKTVFDNTEGTALSEKVIIFEASEPVTTVTASSITIHRYNSFAALVSGIGTITAKEYTHSRNVITRTISANPDGSTVSVSDCTMINASNSENVADRLYEYYSAAEKVSNEIKLTDQFCGRCYAFTNPFDEAKTGYLSKIDLKVSTVLKAACEFICGYAPESPGSNYSHGILLTGSGTWTVPEEVFEKTNPRIRVHLIAGGTGGNSGLAGANGESASTGMSSTTAAKGGKRGTNGAGGKVYTVTIDNPSASYQYSCGTGGAGAAICYSTETANTGSAGGDTTFGDYSSEDGIVKANGITNFFSGQKYATKITDIYSYAGGDGGYHTCGSDSITWYKGGYAFYFRDPFASMGSIYEGGDHGSNYLVNGGIAVLGGNGGGASAGGVGSNGGAATSSRCGDGGAGSNATVTPLKVTSFKNHADKYGCGGIGGYGGGAGGSSGTTASGYSASVGSGGQGGYGGAGGQGADGCIIIYY